MFSDDDDGYYTTAPSIARVATCAVTAAVHDVAASLIGSGPVMERARPARCQYGMAVGRPPSRCPASPPPPFTLHNDFTSRDVRGGVKYSVKVRMGPSAQGGVRTHSCHVRQQKATP